MQAPHFAASGVDLGAARPGILNFSIAPCRYSAGSARHAFQNFKWHPLEPAEDFSFSDVWLMLPAAAAVVGQVDDPHPDTKPEYFQQPDVLELLLPTWRTLTTARS